MKLERGNLKRNRKHLMRRYEWLTDRIICAKTPVSFDLAERLALQCSITIITALLEGQKVEVSGDRANSTRNVVGQAQGRSAH